MSPQNRPLSQWLAIIMVLVLLAYLAPFTILSGVDAWYGSFFFWSVFALAVIAVIIRISMKWRD